MSGVGRKWAHKVTWGGSWGDGTVLIYHHYILTVVVVTQMYESAKTHKTVQK